MHTALLISDFYFFKDIITRVQKFIIIITNIYDIKNKDKHKKKKKHTTFFGKIKYVVSILFYLYFNIVNIGNYSLNTIE